MVKKHETNKRITMKLPFISRKKHDKELVEKTTAFEKLSAELSHLKDDLSLSEQQAVSEIEKLRQENEELKEKLLTAIFGNQEIEKQFAELKTNLSLSEQQSIAEIEKLWEKIKYFEKQNTDLMDSCVDKNKEKNYLSSKIFELENQLTEVQKPLTQDDKDRQIKNLKLKIEAKEKEIEEQKNITFRKNQEINKLKNQ